MRYLSHLGDSPDASLIIIAKVRATIPRNLGYRFSISHRRKELEKGKGGDLIESSEGNQGTPERYSIVSGWAPGVM